MYGSIWFILFVSILSVLHSMFLDGRVVFSLFMILCFLDLSFVLVVIFLYGCLVVHCLVVWCFHSPKLAVHFRRVVFVWHHLMCLVLYYNFVLCVFWWISSISRSENQPFFIIVLTWLVVWKFAHSCQISVILFLYPLCEGLLLK